MLYNVERRLHSCAINCQEILLRKRGFHIRYGKGEIKFCVLVNEILKF